MNRFPSIEDYDEFIIINKTICDIKIKFSQNRWNYNLYISFSSKEFCKFLMKIHVDSKNQQLFLYLFIR